VFTGTSRSRIESEGEKDGERNIPEMGSYQPAQFEQALIARGERATQKLFEKSSARIAKLQPSYDSQKRLFQEISGRLNAIVKNYEARKKELGRDVQAPFPYIFHIYLIIFLAVGEFPLNTIVFRLFGEAEFLTYIMASTLAVTIPLLGMFIGVHIRQSVPLLAGNIMIGLIIPISVGAALVSVSMMRNTYMSTQVIEEAVQATGDYLAYAIFSLNLLVFCASVVSAYVAHDPDEQLDNSRKGLIFLNRKRNALQKSVARLAMQINGEIQKAKSRILQVRSRTKEQVALYRQANMRARRLLPPSTFRKDPEFPGMEWWPEVSVDT
jgi:hypothetical protein